MGRHALLSASSSHRWLACPPSARLCENYEDTGSEYAQQGTDAHSLCEHKLKLSLGMETEDPTEGLEFYDEEMEECACGYAEYVLSLVEEAKKTCKDPVVLIEQRLDFSRYVEEGFGTGDSVIIADGMLYIIDYKHGKGVEVSAEGNPQMMLYALGALELFDGIYDIDTVRMAIYQPRRENVSVCVMAKDVECHNVNYADFKLRRISASILGLEEFDEEEFERQIKEIVALEDGSLEYHFREGRVQTWQRM